MSPVPHPLAPEVRPASVRDLAWLIGSLLLVIAPHSLRAPWWLTLLTLCLFAWRFHYALNRAPLPSRWLVLGVAAVAMLGVWIEYRTLFGRQPGILLLSLFAGLKLLETRSHRDAAVAAFLGYFLIITNFLYTQSMPTALLMCAALFAITTTLIGFSAPQRAAQHVGGFRRGLGRDHRRELVADAVAHRRGRDQLTVEAHAGALREAGRGLEREQPVPVVRLEHHAVAIGGAATPRRLEVDQRAHPDAPAAAVEIPQHRAAPVAQHRRRQIGLEFGAEGDAVGLRQRRQVAGAHGLGEPGHAGIRVLGQAP